MRSFLRAFAKTLSREREAAEIWLKSLSKAWRSRDRSSGLQSQGLALYDPSQRILFPAASRLAANALDDGFMEGMAAPSGEQQWALELSDTACAMHGLPAGQREALILVGIGASPMTRPRCSRERPWDCKEPRRPRPSVVRADLRSHTPLTPKSRRAMAARSLNSSRR